MSEHCCRKYPEWHSPGGIPPTIGTQVEAEVSTVRPAISSQTTFIPHIIDQVPETEEQSTSISHVDQVPEAEEQSITIPQVDQVPETEEQSTSISHVDQVPEAEEQSTSGFICYLGDAPVHWGSRKQNALRPLHSNRSTFH